MVSGIFVPVIQATVIVHAMGHYYRNQRDIALVVDQCNTHRFFSSLWIPHNKRMFFIHQLTREIWQQMYPGMKGHIGNFLETVMLKMNRNDNTITVSESTRCDLLQMGFDPDRVVIAPEGLVFEPWLPEEFAEKEGDTCCMLVGSIRIKELRSALRLCSTSK